MYVVIVGAGKVGYNLAQELINEDFKVALVEKDKEKCETLASSINALVINGDGADFLILESAGAQKADYIVSASGSDEVNFVVAMLAKIAFKAKIAIARINDPRNEQIFKKMGINYTFTSTNIVAKLMFETICYKEAGLTHVIPDFLNKKSRLSMFRFVIENNYISIGKTLAELKMPVGSLIIALVRNDDVLIPGGKDIIQSGDVLYVNMKKDLYDKVKLILTDTIKEDSHEMP